MQRRDIEMLLVTIVAGPALSPFVLFVVDALLRFGPIGPTQIDFFLVAATLPFAYLLASPWVLAIGVANTVVARFARADSLRLLLALPIGAVAFAIGLQWLGTEEGGTTPEAIPLAGALVSLLCVALVGSFGTPLRGDE